MFRSTIVVMVMVLVGCISSGNQANEMRLNQYMVEGMVVYRNHCANCHQLDGTGLAKVIPPLKDADFLKSLKPSQLACYIRSGLQDSIVVNGVLYYQPMPANTSLTALEIAEVVTYVDNTWGKKSGLYGVKQAQKDLDQCDAIQAMR